MALAAAQRAVILTGSRPAWATSMDMAWDFTTNRTWTANPITDTHSATIYAQYQNGSFAPFAANTMVRTDLGLQTVPTRVQLITNSTTISTSFGTNTGCTAVENATGPDGSTNGATTITSSGVGDNRRQRNITIANDNTRYTFQALVARTSSAPTYYPAVYLTIVGGTTVSAVAVLNTFTGTIASTGAAGFTATVRPSGAFWIVSVSVSNNTTGNTTMALQLYPSYNTDGTATQNFSANGATVFAWPTAVAADFTYPIPNATGLTATVNGNQQVVDLTGNVGGIIQYTPIGIVSFGNSIAFTDGAAVQAAIEYGSTSGPRILAKGANSGETAVRANSRITVAFAFSEGYQAIQQIGGSKVMQTATSLSITKMAIGGSGIAATANLYQTTQRLAIKRGVQNDATFNDLVAKATILAAVS